MNKVRFTLLFLLLNTYALPFLGDKKEQKMLLETERNTINVFKNNVQSVVNISNIQLARRGFFDMTPMEVPSGSGSGYVWDDKGHIITNYHVIRGSSKVLISFHKDKKQYEAEIVGTEPRKDIAVLKLLKLPKNLRPVKLGNSKALQVGQKVMALGNPFGLDHSITSGIISALGRKITGIAGVSIHGMIQTDASINPGNSGGTLLNSNGELIGMNTMIYSQSGSSSGVGFAVPVHSIKKVVPQIIKYGRVRTPALGIYLLDDYYKDYFDIKKGIIIKSVKDLSPADKAGLQGMKRTRRGEYRLGDIIIGIEDTQVNSYDDIYNALDKHKPGDVVTVLVKRGRKVLTMKIKLTVSN